MNCAESVETLSIASCVRAIRHTLAAYVKSHILVVDEVGHLAYGDGAVNALFHVVNKRRIRRRAMIFTTNKHPKRWGPVLHDEDLADAIVAACYDSTPLSANETPSE